jgi:hypothetical protein
MVPTAGLLADTLRQMATGFARTQELYTAVKLGVADHLAAGPRHARELAQAVNAHPQALHRFLRKLVVLNLLAEEDDGAFRLLPLGELLCANHPGSVRNLVLYIGEVGYPAQQGLLYAVQTGRPAFDHVFGMPFFDFFERRLDLSALFDDLMGQGINDRAAAVVAAYDFSRFDTIVDVGGGNGTLISAILDAYPRLLGIVFDRPGVAAEGRHGVMRMGLADRCQTVAGDFFDNSIPPGRDIYLLSYVIHDWDDERATTILRNCRTAMRQDSRLLLIEEIMPKRAADAPATVGTDLSMLMLTGGRERTEAEYRSLLLTTGLQLTSVIPFEPTRDRGGRSSWTIIESKPLP